MDDSKMAMFESLINSINGAIQTIDNALFQFYVEATGTTPNSAKRRKHDDAPFPADDADEDKLSSSEETFRSPAMDKALAPLRPRADIIPDLNTIPPQNMKMHQSMQPPAPVLQDDWDDIDEDWLNDVAAPVTSTEVDVKCEEQPDHVAQPAAKSGDWDDIDEDWLNDVNQAPARCT